MPDLVYERVQTALTRLKLTRIGTCLDTVAEEAARGEWSYVAFLDRLLEVPTPWSEQDMNGAEVVAERVLGMSGGIAA